MNRNTSYEFVSTDTDKIISEITENYKRFSESNLSVTDPEDLAIVLLIRWFASLIAIERAHINRAGNRNIPSRSDGEDLRVLGELYYNTANIEAKHAVSTERFYISEPQSIIIVIPKGTRITDASKSLYFETVEDAFINPGEISVEVSIRCQTSGIDGNGFEIGTLCELVDVFEYYSNCENTTVSDGGTDILTDDEFYEIMRHGLDGFSTAGAEGSYIYFAKQVSNEISDVVVKTPEAGCVAIYVLMNDGSLASEEIKSEVLKACTTKSKRPLNDLVSAEEAEIVEYSIDFTYFVRSDIEDPLNVVENNIKTAVENYISWQCAKFGRDILPGKLRNFAEDAGAKRIVFNTPLEFTSLTDGRLDSNIPQVAKCIDVKITFGGYENE